MRVPIIVHEDKILLQKKKQASPVHQIPRFKMLLALLADPHASNAKLAAASGSSPRSIARWVKAYATSGLEALLSDNRGGDMRSGISEVQKTRISNKLSDPKGGLRSYGEAQRWVKEELGIDKKYQAFHKYLKRNFGTKLKVGRKSHVKKDLTATAEYKKPSGKA